MFTGGMIETAEADTAGPKEAPATAPETADEPNTINTALPVWHFMLIHLVPGSDVPRIIQGLNDWFQVEGIAARAIDWKKASAGFGITADVLRGVFIGAVLIVAFVAMIIMTNTLTVSVFERTSEIGTMRALGAQRKFVWTMLFAETLILTAVFGLIGISVGVLAVAGIRLLRLEAVDMITNTLYGGPVFQPSVNLKSVVFALASIIAIGVVSSLYPIRLALRIPPVRAIEVE
jgi:putative ABC transport system permease protein